MSEDAVLGYVPKTWLIRITRYIGLALAITSTVAIGELRIYTLLGLVRC